MTMEVRHFVLAPDGAIREFSPAEAALIAAGSNKLPEFAERRVRYLQVSWDDEAAAEMKIQTAGAAIKFDADGRLAEAAPPSAPFRRTFKCIGGESGAVSGRLGST